LDAEFQMPQVELDDQVFKAAQRRAADGGYSTVGEYIADMVVHDMVDEDLAATPDLDHLFTPERIGEIDKAAAEIDGGKFFTAEQVREHFKQKRAAWAQKNDQR
jgi:hypothetical protein